MKTKSDSLLQVRKPKYHEYEVISDIAKRLKRDYKKQSLLSSYYNYEIDTDRLLDVSKGNEKLVTEVLEIVVKHQKEDDSISGFQDIQAFYIRKKELDEVKEWVHVVFDHGYSVTLLAGRVDHTDGTYKQYIEKSNIYSMAKVMNNG